MAEKDVCTCLGHETMKEMNADPHTSMSETATNLSVFKDLADPKQQTHNAS